MFCLWISNVYVKDLLVNEWTTLKCKAKYDRDINDAIIYLKKDSFQIRGSLQNQVYVIICI